MTQHRQIPKSSELPEAMEKMVNDAEKDLDAQEVARKERDKIPGDMKVEAKKGNKSVEPNESPSTKPGVRHGW